MNANELFDGFRPEEYAKEAEERWPDQYAESSRRLARLSIQAQGDLFAEGDRITKELAQLYKDESAIEGAEVQFVVSQHFDWVSQFWTPNRAAYIGLGEMYFADLRFKENYDKYADGLAEFMQDAMKIYANENLAE